MYACVLRAGLDRNEESCLSPHTAGDRAAPRVSLHLGSASYLGLGLYLWLGLDLKSRLNLGLGSGSYLGLGFELDLGFPFQLG